MTEVEFSPEWLRAFRTTLGMSQEHMAQALECSIHSYSLWERGKRTPKDYMVDRLTLLHAAWEDSKKPWCSTLAQSPTGQILTVRRIEENGVTRLQICKRFMAMLVPLVEADQPVTSITDLTPM